MEQVVVGSFLFLRFLIPALVTPDRYHLKSELNTTSKKAVILMSRILQTIANGGAVRGTLSVLQGLVESHQSSLHGYFDTLADISNVSFTGRDLQFAVEPATTYADFNVIVAFLCDLSREMKQVIPVHYTGDYLTKYNEFLNITVRLNTIDF